jgi:hypothetical protein
LNKDTIAMNMNVQTMNKLKDSLSKQADELLTRQAAAAEAWASYVRLGLALTLLTAGLWTWQYAPRLTSLYLINTALWVVAFFAGKARAKSGAQDTMTLIDITLVHLGLLAFVVQGFFPHIGGGLTLFYFPILVAAAARYRGGLVVKAGAYAVLGCLGLTLYAGSPPWFKVAALALTTLVGFLAASAPKTLLTRLGNSAAEQGFEAGAKQQAAELTAEMHQLFMPEPVVNLPLIWSSSKHGTGIETTGDYYHIFETARGPLLVLGDFTGRGVEALKGLARLHQKLIQLVHREPSLPELAEELNRFILEKYEGNRPFTAIFAEWEGEQLRYLNAGHLPILQLNQKHEAKQLPVNNATALGAKLNATFVESVVPFPARELAVLYTDGVYAKVADSREQGAAEIERLVTTFSGAEVTTLCHRIFDCAQPGYDPLKDDGTVVVIRRQPLAVAAATEGKAG